MPLSQTNGRTIATEVLINTPAVANMIREGQVAQLYSAMQAGSAVGMHTLDQDLRRLVSEGTIALNVARDFATDPKSLDGVHVRPRDLDAEEWAHHAGEWRQADPAASSPRTPRPARASAWDRGSARRRSAAGSTRPRAMSAGATRRHRRRLGCVTRRVDDGCRAGVRLPRGRSARRGGREGHDRGAERIGRHRQAQGAGAHAPRGHAEVQHRAQPPDQAARVRPSTSRRGRSRSSRGRWQG